MADIKGKTNGIGSSEFKSMLVSNIIAIIVGVVGYKFGIHEVKEGAEVVGTEISKAGGWLMAVATAIAGFANASYGVGRSNVKRDIIKTQTP